MNCLNVLRSGGIILYPTDTIWGIGCDATDRNAVNRIYALKQRPGYKSMIVLVADIREVNRYVSRPEPYIAEYLEKTSQPTTVIYQGPLGLAENLASDDGTIAIRVIREDFCRHLIKRLRKPLVSTSANISGKETPRLFSEISEEIKQGVDYIVRYRQEESQPSKPSMLVQFSQSGQPVILRS